MKTRPILACLLIATMSLLLFACSPAAEQEVSQEITNDDFLMLSTASREMTVGAGKQFTVTLDSNPSTGFRWELTSISDRAVVAEVAHEFVPPEAKDGSPALPGASGKEVWTFNALKTGTSAVLMSYSRPWEGGEKGVRKLYLTVNVK